MLGLIEAKLFIYVIKALLLHFKFIIENHLYTRSCFTLDPDCTERISCRATFQCCNCVDDFAVVGSINTVKETFAGHIPGTPLRKIFKKIFGNAFMTSIHYLTFGYVNIRFFLQLIQKFPDPLTSTCQASSVG